MNQHTQAAALAAVHTRPDRRRPAFYNVSEAADIMRLDESTLYRHLRNGTFPGLKIGGRYVVPHVVIERLVADILATGRCVDLADWTDQWLREQQGAAEEQTRRLGMVAGGAPW